MTTFMFSVLQEFPRSMLGFASVCFYIFIKDFWLNIFGLIFCQPIGLSAFSVRSFKVKFKSLAVFYVCGSKCVATGY